MKITKSDIINSVANALQYISYYHSKDFIQAMFLAYQKEKNIVTKDAISQILINSKMAAISNRPICQDTGMVNVFVEVGMDIDWDTDLSLDEMINEGVRKAYQNNKNPLRKSIVKNPLFSRENTKDNTPAIIHTTLVKGNKLKFFISAKGAGSENKAKFTNLNPDDNLSDWVVNEVINMGAGWCPPGIISIGVGGSSEKAMLLAKKGLYETINIQEIINNGAKNKTEALRLELYNKINNLGIGAQGLGGSTTVLDVKINTFPTHAASLPIAIIPNCAATRHIHFSLDGKGIATLPEVNIDDYPNLEFNTHSYKKINLDNITKQETKNWKIGETLLLSGTIFTARDAAHKRIKTLLDNGKKLPINLKDKFIYYVGPVDAVNDEVIGSAGPTTATRMDKYTNMILKDIGVIGMIGKAERGKNTIKEIKKNQAVYLIAVGGAAYLISKAIKKAKVIAFDDLGMEAIYKLEIKDFPVTVAVDTQGNNIHKKFQTVKIT
ncbi:Fumarate hydratase class I, aerobic [hydrothermal vent metagenome]|uniref:fumarate hydratase n=1 Tax=hydrothermal vent metagenome TaxID=652676 RepID=A0A1W1CJX5_9ZZZZ